MRVFVHVCSIKVCMHVDMCVCTFACVHVGVRVICVCVHVIFMYVEYPLRMYL